MYNIQFLNKQGDKNGTQWAMDVLVHTRFTYRLSTHQRKNEAGKTEYVYRLRSNETGEVITELITSQPACMGGLHAWAKQEVKNLVNGTAGRH